MFRACPLCIRLAQLSSQGRANARMIVKRKAAALDRKELRKAIRLITRPRP